MFFNIGNKLLILCNVVAGYCIKWKIDVFGPGKLYPLERQNDGANLIVSLTSYGRRVRKTVYYTLVSLLRQSLPPNRIVLWLSSDEWSENSLPKKLKRLEKYGVEYRFCNDILSYKKLIPTLKIAPKDIIVTVDDDTIYSRDLLSSLYEEHRNFPEAICCGKALIPALSEKGEPLPYKTWKEAKSSIEKEERILFPIGVGGILYPPESLHEDIFLQECFMSLCANADDIWFWVMARKKGTTHRIVRKKNTHYSFDALHQFLHKSSSLSHKNRKKNRNDVQLGAVLKKYPVL